VVLNCGPMLMIDDWLLSLIYAGWLAASTMPMSLMLGSACIGCCGCGGGKPSTDPKDEGTWVPSGTWRGAGGVTWSFTANPGDESGETWFFYGSISTSKLNGFANAAEIADWGNICNWYSNKTTTPSSTSGLPGAFDKRATRLPPVDAVVHVYSIASTASIGPQTVKNFYLWAPVAVGLTSTSEVTTTAPAHDSTGGALIAGSTFGILNGGATVISSNSGTINDGATFARSFNFGTVNGGALFYDGDPLFGQSAGNNGTVNGGAEFNQGCVNDFQGTVNGGATFNNSSQNGGRVNDGATFNNFARNDIGGEVFDGATFNNDAANTGFGTTVNGGATFNDNSKNLGFGTVNGGATFNDAACSTRIVGDFFAVPCTRKFVAHPTDLPTCNGTAPAGCDNSADICGCG